jgi:hypothetical protein
MPNKRFEIWIKKNGKKMPHRRGEFFLSTSQLERLLGGKITTGSYGIFIFYPQRRKAK